MKRKHNEDRLLDWAYHLLYGELKNKPYKIKDPSIFIPLENGDFKFVEPFFRYIIAELPEIFPEDWVEIDGEAFWILDEHKNFVSSVQKFFGLEDCENIVQHLCVPLRQNIERYHGKILLPNASVQDIAVNIIELVYKLNCDELKLKKICLN